MISSESQRVLRYGVRGRLDTFFDTFLSKFDFFNTICTNITTKHHKTLHCQSVSTW